MFKFICKSVPHLRPFVRRPSETQEVQFFQLNLFSSLSGEALKLKSENNNANQDSYVVNYLINKCGFAPEKALSASKYVKFDKPDKPDAVISFFKNQGFTETQLQKLIRKFPPVILCDIEKTLLPKIDFFMSQGVSKSDLLATLAEVPQIFKASLEKNVKPTLDLMKKLFGSDKDLLVTIKRCPTLLRPYVVNNIEILREAGVPEARIAYLFESQSRAVVSHSDKFKNLVEEMKKMGINPLNSTFVIGICVMGGLSKVSWEKKIGVYKRWGCSENEVLMAFTKNPWCMAVSEDKIERIMEYFVNEMDWTPSMLLQHPTILSFSLKRRIIPRCAVYRVLLSYGFIKERPSLYKLLTFSEETFRKRFVECFKQEVPELLKLYEEKMKLSK